MPLRTWTIASLALAAALAAGHTQAADAEAGGRLAKTWCANCHLVGDGVGVASDAAPPFSLVATYPEPRIRGFIADPHPPMPKLQLTRQQIDDIVAYLQSLQGG